MNATWTHIEVLVQLAREVDLCERLRLHGLEVQQLQISDAERDHEDSRAWAFAVAGAIERLPSDARERLIAELHTASQLGDAPGRQAMYQAATLRADILAGLTLCSSDLHRSFWLYHRHRETFNLARASDYLATHSLCAQQFDLGVNLMPRRDAQALEALRAAISQHYRHHYGCGDTCVLQLTERSAGVYMLQAYIRDLPTLRLEFVGEAVRRRVGHPSIHLVLEYSPATGIARTSLRGSSACHRKLVEAFARHLLGVDQIKARPMTVDLSPLRMGVELHRPSRGFTKLQVQQITAMSANGVMSVTYTIVEDGYRDDITAEVRKNLPGSDPLGEQWVIVSARLVLHRMHEPGAPDTGEIVVDITHTGRLNLTRFNAQLQAQIEGYLVDVGVLLPGQTLHAVVDAPAGEIAHGTHSA